MAVIGYAGGGHANHGYADRLRRVGAEEVVADMEQLAAALAR
jgi:beta-phosphoglucomutase-like phosphatase (HAD superfamily)